MILGDLKVIKKVVFTQGLRAHLNLYFLLFFRFLQFYAYAVLILSVAFLLVGLVERPKAAKGFVYMSSRYMNE